MGAAIIRFPSISLGKGKGSPISSTGSTLLFMLSACRRTVGRKLKAASAWLRTWGHRAPSASASSSPASDTRRHTPVCCCLRCEQQGTGEQAMRSVRGDYRRFLWFVGARSPRASFPAEQTNSSSEPALRWAAGPELSEPR